MAKFSTKEKRYPTEVNEMGEKAYKLSDKENLVDSVLTTFLQDGYYEKEKTKVDNILRSADKCDAEFVAKLALYARKEANMRSVSHLLAGYLASRISGKEYARRFYRNICNRPDDMAEILAYYKSKEHKGKMPNAMRSGFKSYMEGLDAYQIDKYKMKGRTFSLKDLANLCHIKPTQKNEEAYNRLFNGESLDDLYESNILNKALTATEGDDELKGEVFRRQLEEGMPIFALLRNLVNIATYSPDQVDLAVEQLTNKKVILKSKILPFRFGTAYSEVDKRLSYSGSSIKFEKGRSIKKKLMDALEVAIGYSVENIPVLKGNTAILIDHSGSVRGDVYGDSKVSAFSKTTTAHIGNLFGAMYGYAQDNVYIGLFGDRLIEVPIDRSIGVLEFNKKSYGIGAECGGGTETGLYEFLSTCIKEKTRVDTLVIFSDMVIGNDGRGGWDRTSNYHKYGNFQTLFKEFKKLNPQCLTISVNVMATGGKSVFDRSLNVMQISGWSERIFDQIAGASIGHDAVIKEVEKIAL